MKILLALTVLAIPAAAHADQCQLLDAETAQRVRPVVMKATQFAELCEPCGETVPGVPFKPSAVAIDDELVLDGKPRDLAYTYVRTSPNRFENLAMLVGCPVDGVSPSLHVEAETPDGVLITAGDTPVRRVVEPAPEVAAPPAPPPPTPPAAPPTYYSTTIVYAVPWVAIAAVAGGAGFLLGVCATLVAFALRRRRAMTPRAQDLRL